MFEDKDNYWCEEYRDHKISVTAALIDDDLYAAVAHVILPDGKLATPSFRASHFTPNNGLFSLVRKEAVEAARGWIDDCIKEANGLSAEVDRLRKLIDRLECTGDHCLDGDPVPEWMMCQACKTKTAAKKS